MAKSSREASQDEIAWSANDAENSNNCSTSPEICSACRAAMASPKNLETFVKTGVRLCFSTQKPTRCAFNPIAEAAMASFKQEMDPAWVEDWSPEGFLVLGGHVSYERKKKTEWYDIDNVSLEYAWPSTGKTRPLLGFDVFALPGDPAAPYVRTRSPRFDIASEETFSIIKTWIDTCEKEHTACPAIPDTPLPTRLIDVSPSTGAGTVRLCSTSDAVGRYAALSYCWGGPQVMALTKATMVQMQQGIRLHALPKTLQDAVLTTRRLGLKYLWIDALCIIQDSREDKEDQLKSMAEVYRNSTITIAAASAESVEDGFLQTRLPIASQHPRLTMPYRVWEDKSIEGSVILQEAFRTDPFADPINRRAWTLQERLLSPRLLIYGTHDLVWQCQAEQFTSAGRTNFLENGSQRLPQAFFHPRQTLSPKWFLISWEDTVIDYTRRQLSFAEDKLVALAAIASEFQILSDGDTYLAGIWGRRLREGLLWLVDPSEKQSLKPRPATYVAPSWSWASVNGAIAFASPAIENKAGKGYIEVLGCETTPENSQLPTGRVVGGVLRVRGQVRFSRRTETTLWNEPGPEADPVGKAWMDADEDTPEMLSCLRTDVLGGVLLRPTTSQSTFRRVGRFEFLARIETGYVTCDQWFAGCKYRTVVIE